MDDALKYTAEDINLYLAGKLTPAQMHALEKAALNDPFLADALEGIKLYENAEQFKADVDDLKSRLLVRAQRKQVALTTIKGLWWKVAAVLVLVITGVALIVFTGRNAGTDNREIVKNETEFYKPKQKEQASSPATPKSDTTMLSQQDNNAAKLQADTHDHVPTPLRTKKQSRAVTSEPSPDFSPAPDSIAHYETTRKSEIKNEGDLPRALEGRAAGIDIASADTSDAAFDEVVVVGNPSPNRVAKPRAFKAVTSNHVIPGNSWQEFEQYLRDSASIGTADSVYRGEEEVLFTIGDDGLPDSIRVLRSVSPSHDKEAIRLLENGPAWKVVKGRKKAVRLKIIF